MERKQNVEARITQSIIDGTYAALALWAIRVLDRWAEAPIARGLCGESWTCERYHQGKEEWKVCASGKGGRIAYGKTPGHARITAASALVAEDPTLDDKG